MSVPLEAQSDFEDTVNSRSPTTHIARFFFNAIYASGDLFSSGSVKRSRPELSSHLTREYCTLFQNTRKSSVIAPDMRTRIRIPRIRRSDRSRPRKEKSCLELPNSS